MIKKLILINTEKEVNYPGLKQKALLPPAFTIRLGSTCQYLRRRVQLNAPLKAALQVSDISNKISRYSKKDMT